MRNIVLLIIALLCGVLIGRYSQQNANDLITAGFTITDPQGYSVDRFDDVFGL